MRTRQSFDMDPDLYEIWQLSTTSTGKGSKSNWINKVLRKGLKDNIATNFGPDYSSTEPLYKGSELQEFQFYLRQNYGANRVASAVAEFITEFFKCRQ